MATMDWGESSDGRDIKRGGGSGQAANKGPSALSVFVHP